MKAILHFAFEAGDAPIAGGQDRINGRLIELPQPIALSRSKGRPPHAINAKTARFAETPFAAACSNSG
jgi:hypothetical protein